MAQPLWKKVWRFLKKKLKIGLPYDPAIPLLSIHLDKILIQKHTCTLNILSSNISIAKTWKEFKCPAVGEWIKKLWSVCVPLCMRVLRHMSDI